MAFSLVMPKFQWNQIKTQWNCGVLRHREVGSYIGSHGKEQHSLKRIASWEIRKRLEIILAMVKAQSLKPCFQII